MHNGCLLLLAFVAVFQPIASYSERGLVNGRQQRCDYRTSLRDPGDYFHGTYRFTKPAVEDRRLSAREDREVRRNEVRGNTVRTASSSDRRLVETERNTPTALSRDRVGSDAILRRDIREGRLIANHRDERNTRERLSKVQESHQDHRLTRRDSSRLVDDGSRQQSRIDNRRANEPRVSVESRRDTRRNGNNAEAQRVKEYREVRVASQRASDEVASRLVERRIAREAVQRMDTRRSVSTELSRNMDREVLDRRSRNSEIRSSSMSSDRVNRAFNNEDSHRSLDRVERRTISSRRYLDEPRQQRDTSRIQRQSLKDERNNIRDSANQRNIRDLHDRTLDNVRARSTDRDARLRAVRLVHDRLPQNERMDSRIFERARSAENRMELRQARSAENRNDIREIERQSEAIRNERAATLRTLRNVERDLKRNAPVRGEIRNNNKDACAFQRVQSSEHVIASMLTRERAALSERNSRNMARENRIRRLERTNQQDAQILRKNRSINRQQSQESRRQARDVSPQTLSTEHTDAGGRRISRNVDSRASRTVRAVDNRRDSRNVDSRLHKGDRIEENERDIRNFDSRAFRTERTIEARRNSRKTDSGMVKSDENRRYIRNIDSLPFRTERSAENRRDSRSVNPRMVRSERTDESRREARTVDSRAFGPEPTADSRRESRDLKQSQSLDRVSRYRRDSRNYERDARIQNRILESRRNFRNTEAQSRAEDERVISNRRARSLERQARSLSRERTMENRLNTRTIARQSRTFVIERRERAAENRRDARNIRSESRLSDNQDSRRVASRVNNLVQSRDDATERLSKRDSLDSRRNHNLQRESRRETQITSARDNLVTRSVEAETRSFNTEFAGKHEVQNMYQAPKQSDDEAPAMNWQYLLYSLQGLYICGVLIQLMGERSVEKKNRSSWWPVPQHLIKVD